MPQDSICRTLNLPGNVANGDFSTTLFQTCEFGKTNKADTQSSISMAIRNGLGDLCKDIELVRAAVSQDGLALRHAVQEFKEVLPKLMKPVDTNRAF
eukprot:1136718-Amphidinium_carterae.1